MFLTDTVLPGQSPTQCQTSPQRDTVYCLTSWEDNRNLTQPFTSTVQTVTADPSITSLTATLTVAYRFQLNFYAAPGPNTPPTCGAPSAIPPGEFRPGVVYVNNQCYWASGNIFIQAGSVVPLNAYPYPGFVFLGWTNSQSSPNSFLTSVVANNPITLEPHFSPAQRVTFLTAPSGLEVNIDHTVVPTRQFPNICNDPQPVAPLTGFPPMCTGDFDFAPGSSHNIAGVSPQRDKTGNWWVFDHWSDGVPQNGLMVVGNNLTSAQTVTASFDQGAQVGFLTSPN